MNKYSSFTINQIEYMKKMEYSWFNALEGGKRGGKNITDVFAFCLQLESHPNKFHMIGGVTLGSAKLNILESDGYGMTNFFEGRIRIGKYMDKPAAFVKTKTGIKIVIISGGGKNGDEASIKGNTYGIAYITEANECSKIYIKEVFDRTMSSKKRIIIHDFNPKSDGHWYYTEILAFHEAKQKENPNYGYNYGHLTIMDNMSLSNLQIKTILNTYDKNSLWYKRDILGMRSIAEGLVYNFNPDRNILSNKIIVQCDEYYISCDYGIYNPMAWGFFGIKGDRVYQFEEYHHSGREQPQNIKDDFAYIEDFKKFYSYCQDKYNADINSIIVDPSASSFIVSLRRAGYKVKNAYNAVVSSNHNEGIPLVSKYINNGNFKISENCNYTIKEFGLYSWNDKSVDKDVPIKEDDHHMDAIRYLFNTVIRKIGVPNYGIVGA